MCEAACVCGCRLIVKEVQAKIGAFPSNVFFFYIAGALRGLIILASPIFVSDQAPLNYTNAGTESER